MPETAIRCTGVHKSYGDVHALRGLDLEVHKSECFGLLGPNGAGKTTTIEILEGLMPADAGTVEVLGCQWGATDDRALRERIGVQLQNTELSERLTVAETIRLFRSLYRKGRDVDAIISSVELDEKRHARLGKLSGGQRQRVALACALVSTPELLFLDEPTTGLDPQARLKLWEMLERYRQDGGTILITTHYMEEAARLCDRVAIVDHGIIIALGTPRELIASIHADKILTIELGATAQEHDDLLARMNALPGVGTCRQEKDRFSMAVTDLDATLPALLALVGELDAPMTSLEIHQPTLEDVFVALTGRGLRDA